MFTLQAIKTAHGKVKSGADFPKYIQEIKNLGLLTYEFMVKNGAINYHGAQGYQVQAPGFYEPLAINPTASASSLRHSITIHQQGETDFLTFCQQAAHAGVEKWIIDTVQMACTYLDLEGNILVIEPIPSLNQE